MTRIKLIKNHDDHKKGQVFETSKKFAEYLIKSEIAVETKEKTEAEKKAEKTKK